MDTNRIGSSPPAMRGAGALPAGEEQLRSQSTVGRAKPRTLADLPQHRSTLSDSPNPVARDFVGKLETIQNKFANGQINADEHRAECYEIMEAAEHHVTKNGNGALIERDYVAICDDLSLQLDSERGVGAQVRRNAAQSASAVRGRGNFFHRLSQIPAQAQAHVQAHVQAQARRWSASTTETAAYNNAIQDLARGLSPDAVIALNNVTNPEHIVRIRESTSESRARDTTNLALETRRQMRDAF